MSNVLFERHPELENCRSFMTKYSNFDANDNLLECWIKDKATDEWIDITEIERLKLEIKNAQKELDKLV